MGLILYNYTVGDLQVFGLCLLYYLVPDATVKVDLAKIVTIMKVGLEKRLLQSLAFVLHVYTFTKIAK